MKKVLVDVQDSLGRFYHEILFKLFWEFRMIKWKFREKAWFFDYYELTVKMNHLSGLLSVFSSDLAALYLAVSLHHSIVWQRKCPPLLDLSAHAVHCCVTNLRPISACHCTNVSTLIALLHKFSCSSPQTTILLRLNLIEFFVFFFWNPKKPEK